MTGDTLLIVGAGGHGRDVADIAEACGWRPVFLDDKDRPGVVGRPSELNRQPHVVAVNDPQTRARLAVGARPVTLVHPTAVVSRTAILEPGVVVGANATIGPHTVIGEHTHIGAGCTITRTTINHLCAIGPGVDIAGDCWIGQRVFIGTGACVKNLTTIGDRATVGMGAVVIRDVEPDDTVAGVPARRLHGPSTALWSDDDDRPIPRPGTSDPAMSSP